MKSLIRLSFVLAAAIFFTGCSKFVVDVEPAVSGSWVLTDASGKDNAGWYSIDTGLEGGVFDFYSNGSATYSGNGMSMHGSWGVTYTTGGYYDEYGNYYSNSHQSMTVHMSDGYGNTIDMYFDDINVYSGSFTGTVYDGHTLEKYHFSRY